MKKLTLVILLSLISCVAWCQQSETEAVKKVVNTMFEAMRKGDSSLLKSTFHKSMVLHSVGVRNGASVLSVESADDFAKAIGVPHKGIYNERIVFGDIKIDGSLASVWAPYKFYLDDKFSHCGVDVFQLMKTSEGWKIIYIADTRRKDNCPD